MKIEETGYQPMVDERIEKYRKNGIVEAAYYLRCEDGDMTEQFEYTLSFSDDYDIKLKDRFYDTGYCKKGKTLPGLVELIHVCVMRPHPYDIVLVYDPTRIATDANSFAEAKSLIEKNGTEIIFMNQFPAIDVSKRTLWQVVKPYGKW